VRLFAVEWNVWSQLEDSARYFADAAMLAVYRDIAAAVRATSDPDGAVALYDAYRVAAGNTVRIAAEYIRADPHRFIHLS
jgi:hypothetical protein